MQKYTVSISSDFLCLGERMITTFPVKAMNTFEGCWGTNKQFCQGLSYRGTYFLHEMKKINTT